MDGTLKNVHVCSMRIQIQAMENLKLVFLEVACQKIDNRVSMRAGQPSVNIIRAILFPCTILYVRNITGYFINFFLSELTLWINIMVVTVSCCLQYCIQV